MGTKDACKSFHVTSEQNTRNIQTTNQETNIDVNLQKPPTDQGSNQAINEAIKKEN